jgi:hypothetical protein
MNPMATTEVAIWEQIIRPEGSEMDRETAQAILRLSFSADDRARMRELLGKAKEGKLRAEEELEIDGYERAGTLLSILKAKARRILKPRSRYAGYQPTAACSSSH